MNRSTIAVLAVTLVLIAGTAGADTVPTIILDDTTPTLGFSTQGDVTTWFVDNSYYPQELMYFEVLLPVPEGSGPIAYGQTAAWLLEPELNNAIGDIVEIAWDPWDPVLNAGSPLGVYGTLFSDLTPETMPYELPTEGGVIETGGFQDLTSNFMELDRVTPATLPLGLHVLVASDPVPEPSSFLLLGISAISLLAYGWRRRATAP